GPLAQHMKCRQRLTCNSLQLLALKEQARAQLQHWFCCQLQLSRYWQSNENIIENCLRHHAEYLRTM
ncbi:unnamed protein product, partial [Parnassius apollo]